MTQTQTGGQTTPDQTSPHQPKWVRPLIITAIILTSGLVAAPMMLSGQDIMDWARTGLNLHNEWPWIVFYALDASAIIAVLIYAYRSWQGRRAIMLQAVTWSIAGLSAFAQYKHGKRIQETAPDAWWFFPILALSGPLILEILLHIVRSMQQERAGQIAKPRPKFPVWRWIPGVGSFKETYGAWRVALLLNIDTYNESVLMYRTIAGGRWKVLDAVQTYQTQTATRPVRTNWKRQTTKPKTTPTTGPKQADHTKQTRPPLTDQAPDQTYITAIQTHPMWPETSLSTIQTIVAELDPNGECGRGRAIRLREKAKETE